MSKKKGKGLDCLTGIQQYVQRMLEQVTGMKVLVLDKHTTPIVSMVFSQSDALSKDVYLIENLRNSQEQPSSQPKKGLLRGFVEEEKKEDTAEGSSRHLKGVCMLRPTPANLELLKSHLRQPMYSELHVFFTGMLPQGYLSVLAEHDTHSHIKQVQEFYADYVAINDTLFSLNLPSTLGLYRDSWSREDTNTYHRAVDGLLSVCLSAKKRPAIRYMGSSRLCKKMAFDVQRKMAEEAALFSFYRPGDTEPLLLILDRREDPVTPLLTQWTYQAMIHELLDLHDARVNLRGAPDVKADQQEVVMHPSQDTFFDDVKYSNFGELGDQIKVLVQKHQQRAQVRENIATIADMQRVVESIPELRRHSGHVSKHVTVLSELSRLVEVHHLLDVSSIEQELACGGSHSDNLKEVLNLVRNPRVQDCDKLRVVMLYALRYDKLRNDLPALRALLRDTAKSDRARERVQLINKVLRHCGTEARSGDLFSNRSISAKLNKLIGGLQGVENVYTQHEPVLQRQLAALLKGTLKSTDFPQVDGRMSSSPPREVFVFIMGGATYEEAQCVHDFNQRGDVRIVLGGTHVHNSRSFLADIEDVRPGYSGTDGDVRIDLK